MELDLIGTGFTYTDPIYEGQSFVCSIGIGYESNVTPSSWDLNSHPLY